MEWASLIVIENPAYGRAIFKHHGAGRIGCARRRIRRSHDNCHRCCRIIACEALRRLGLLALENGLFDLPQAAHLAPHLNLGVAVRVQYGLGQIAEEMVVAIAMGHAGELCRDPRHERVLLIRDPEGNPLVQGRGPRLGLGDQPLDLIVGCRDQGLGEPHPLLGEFPHDIEGLVSLLGLQPVNRKHDLVDRFVLATQGFGWCLTVVERLVS